MNVKQPTAAFSPIAPHQVPRFPLHLFLPKINQALIATVYIAAE